MKHAPSQRRKASGRRGHAPKPPLLEQVLEITSECILTLDHDWRFTFLNERARKELLPAEDLLGRHVLEAYPSLTDTSFWPAYQEVMNEGRHRHLEGYVPDLGSWYEVHAAPIADGIAIFFRNIDLRRTEEEALRQKESNLRKTLDHIPQMVWSTRPDGFHDYYSRPWYEFTGVPEGSTDGEAWNGMFHPDDQGRAWAIWRHSLQTGDPYEIEYRLRHHSGEYRWVLGRAWPERNTDGEIVRWYGTCTDIHDRISAQQALAESELLQRSVLEASADCIMILNLEGDVEFINGPGLRAVELQSPEAFLGKSWSSLVPSRSRNDLIHAVDEARSGQASRFTGYCPTAAGTPKWWDVLITPMMNSEGRPIKLLSVARDITDLREASEKLRWASEHDALTSLPNRRAFEDRLRAAVADASKQGRAFGLLLLDLDHFKHFNDTLGHSAGDDLLRKFSERLRDSTRSADFVGRLGGDEFAVLLENVVDEKELATVGTSILSRLQRPIVIEGAVFSGGASIGGALFPRDAASAEELLKNADTALYALKASGRGGTRIFHGSMREEAQKIASQLHLARTGLTEVSVIPHYQPKVHLETGAVVGFEALLRWRSRSGRILSPDSVAHAFKDYQLSTKVGGLMQDRVFQDLARWHQNGMNPGRISVNAAPAEFLRDDYAEQLLDALERHGLPAETIEIEVTEHVFLDRGSSFVARALRLLKENGIRIALDDFGTGHSSLSNLRDFPVDIIKIDRSFTAQITSDPQITAIVSAIVDLSRSLALEVVAEGVENVDQMKFLERIGCTFGQGWLFGRPVPTAEISTVCRRCR